MSATENHGYASGYGFADGHGNEICRGRQGTLAQARSFAQRWVDSNPGALCVEFWIESDPSSFCEIVRPSR